MKKLRKSKWSKFFSLLLSIILIHGFISCNTDYSEIFRSDKKEGSATINSKNSQSFTGEDIFRGIYFLTGNVANTLETLEADVYNEVIENLTETELQQIYSFQNDIINSINVNNSNFFDDFYEDMVSGDHFEIQKAMDLSLFEYKKAIIGMAGFDDVESIILNSDLHYEDFLDSNGNFDINLFDARVSEIFNENPVNGEYGRCLAIPIAIMAVLVVVAAYGAALAAVVGVVGGLYLGLVVGEWVVVTSHFWSRSQIDENDLLKVEVFIDEVSEKLFVPTL